MDLILQILFWLNILVIAWMPLIKPYRREQFGINQIAWGWRMTAKEWNRRYTDSTLVLLVQDNGKIRKTVTRSFAWDLGDGSSVVLVDGMVGGYSLHRLIPVDNLVG
jgi:hypothetical protein